MTRKTFFVSRWRAVCQILALIALSVSIVVPSGFMAARENGGPLRIVMCSGYGPVSVAAPPELAERLAANHHQQNDDDRHKDHATPCPFAGHTGPLSAPVDYAISQQATHSGPVLATEPLKGLEPGRGMAAPPPPSQAPPAALI